MRKALILILLCLPLTILGCSKGVVETLKWDAPLVVDVAPVACPEIGSKTRAEFGRTTPRPAPDTVGDDGKAYVSKDATRAWIDALEVSEAQKNKAGQALVKEHDRCRGDAPPAKPIS